MAMKIPSPSVNKVNLSNLKKLVLKKIEKKEQAMTRYLSKDINSTLGAIVKLIIVKNQLRTSA